MAPASRFHSLDRGQTNDERYIFFRVYDIKSRSLVQSNIGHRACIRSLIHIPERQQVRSNLRSFAHAQNTVADFVQDFSFQKKTLRSILNSFVTELLRDYIVHILFMEFNTVRPKFLTTPSLF